MVRSPAADSAGKVAWFFEQIFKPFGLRDTNVYGIHLNPYTGMQTAPACLQRS
jgi:hypothetical protein